MVPLTSECCKTIAGAELRVPDLEDAAQRERLPAVVAVLSESLRSLSLPEGVAVIFT
jgi:hypothetical protein